MSVSAVRWAVISDLQFLGTAGPSHYSEPILRRKIEWNEAIVATMNGSLAGYMILDHLWSSLPFIATIFVLE